MAARQIALLLRELREMKPVLHNRNLLCWRDTVFQTELAPLRLGNCDNPRGNLRQQALDCQEETSFAPAEVTMKHVPVIRMDHHRHAGKPSCSPPQCSGFGSMGMQNLGLLSAENP